VYNTPLLVMNTKNPKLQFYKLMYQFLTAPDFIEMLAKEIIRLWKEHRDSITFVKFSMQDLMDEHDERHQRTNPWRTEFMENLLEALSRDLFTQLRCEEVQNLVLKYRWLETHNKVLVAHARRIRLTGKGGAATITLVVNDWRLFLVAMGEGIPNDVWRLCDGDAPNNVDLTIMSYEKPD
jgi:hypothetical protein